MTDFDIKLAYTCRDETAKAFGYWNKCVPIAFSMILRIPVLQVIEELDREALERGRVNNSTTGYYPHEYKAWFRRQLMRRKLRDRVIPLDTVRQHAKTIRTLTPAALRKLGVTMGYVSVSGHMAGIIDGQVVDWSEERVYRIHNLHTIEPM